MNGRRVLVLVAILLIVFSLAGCDEKKTTVKKGRMVEKKLSSSELLDDEHEIEVVFNADGIRKTYVRSGKGKQATIYLVTSSGKKQKKEQSTELTARYADGFTIDYVTMGLDGKEYILLSKQENIDENGVVYTDEDLLGEEMDYSTEQYQKLQKRKVGMGTRETKLLLCEGEDVTPITWAPGISSQAKVDTENANRDYRYIQQGFRITKAGKLVYPDSGTNTFYVYDFQKQTESAVATVPASSAWGVYAERLYVTSVDTTAIGNSGVVDCYNLDPVTKENSIATEVALTEEMNPVLALNEAGDIYILNKEGLYCYAKNGNLWEKKLEGNKFTFGAANHQLLLLEAGADRTQGITVKMYQKQTHLSEYYHYYFDKTVQSSADKKLTIYSLWNCASIKEAVRAYQNEHSSIEIDYVVAGANGENQEDLIQELNTEILAGKGADILVTDGLPIRAYEKKKILMDLSSVVDANKLLCNIQKTYQSNGKIYSVPVRIAVPLLYMPTDEQGATDSMEHLAEYASSLGTGLFYQEPVPLLERLLYTYSDEVFNQDGGVDQDKLKEFLSEAKRIYDSCSKESIQTIVENNQQGQVDQLFAASLSDILLRVNGTKGGQLLWGNSKSPRDYSMFFAIQKELATYASTVNNCFVSGGTVAINAQTKQPAAAKDFVKYLLSDTSQESDNNDGYPVTSSALKKWKEKNRASVEFGGYLNAQSQVVVYMSVENSDAQQQQIVNTVMGTTQSIYQDTRVVSMIATQAAGYLSGEDSLEAVTDEVIQKVNTYVKEQQ